VLGFMLLAAVLTGLLFGFAPALQAPGTAIHNSLKDANRGSSEGQRQHWIRSALVVSEVAFTCVLLVGAGLLIRSFLRILDSDLGFRPENTVSMRIDPGPQYNTRTLRNNYFDDVFRRVRAIQGVASAGLTDGLPLGSNRSWGATDKEHVYSDAHQAPDAFVHVVSDGYLQAMGIGLRAGRDFDEHDNATARPVILVNETLAHRLWPGEDPLGRILNADLDRQVIGIVKDVHHLALDQDSGNEMYIPIRQSDDIPAVDLVVRGSLPPAALASTIRASLRAIDPNLATSEFRTLQQIVDKSISPRRFIVYLLGGFAAFALILVSLGIYGVISYTVSRRTQDIGIRMALGASAGRLQSRIVLNTLGLAGLGMLAGVAGCWFLTRALARLLFEITPGDPLTFAAVVAILTLVATAAGYIPARRASQIDPMTALRVN
jgi:predicted permease